MRALLLWARRLKRDAVTLWFAKRHPQTPIWLKAFCVLIVAYALSPIDLIPDFIPVLGYVDDAILLPAFIWLALRLLPEPVLQESRKQAQAWLDKYVTKPREWAGAILVVSCWALVLALAWMWWRG